MLPNYIVVVCTNTYIDDHVNINSKPVININVDDADAILYIYIN